MQYELGRCRLAIILREIGWTQQDLADNTRIDKTTVSKYVTGDRTISYLNSIVITETIFDRVGIRYSPRDLYEIIRK